MLWVTVVILEQESASLVTIKIAATPVTPELGLVQEGYMTTPTRVETRLHIMEIMETNTSKPWDTSWCSDKKNKNNNKKSGTVTSTTD